MKFHDRSRTMRPDSTVLIPLALLFVTSLVGPSLPEAIHHGVHHLFSLRTGPVVWLQVLLLNLALYLYFMPVFKLHIRCLKACPPGMEGISLALKRLNGLYPFTIGASVLTAVLGKAVLLTQEAAAAGLPPLSGKTWIYLLEAGAGGFFVGVILALHFEDRLFKARETILEQSPGSKLAYVSLYSKVFLALFALLSFMTFQTFAAAGNFYALGVPRVGGSRFPLSGPEFILEARRFSGIKEALDVFLLRMGLLLLFVGVLVYEVKRLIARPIATVLDRLETLNSPEAGSASAIGIIQNDEFAAVYREINTLIERQQDEVETSRRRLSDLVENAADPILALDREGKIRLFNPAAENLFGYAKSDIIGRDLGIFLGGHLSEFLAAHTEDGRLKTALDDHLHTREDREGLARFHWRASDGSIRLMESHLSQGEGEGEGWTTIILRDITRQVEFEEGLRRARVEAETASRMKSEFLANMSHELRTPLNAILGFTQLLQGDKNLTGAQEERIRVISRSGEHLLSIINDILDISKIEAGKMELHETVFDLPEFVGDLKDLFELRCKKKGLSLYVDSAGELPRYVRGDLGKIRQVMVNLIGNAVKFTSEGGIGILVGMVDGKIRFSVTDTGRGIPKAEQEAILLPFVQASTTDHEGGTGLGLAISSRFIAMMGGSLAVQSELGKGSTFSFSIPLPAADEAPETSEEGETSIEVMPGTEVSVLVVDDQEANRLVLKEMLERAGLTVLEARNGREAVERARELLPSIIFMDIKMPVMDGYEAAEMLKSDESTRGIRIFALTASAFTHDEERIRSSGFDGFLTKPFKLGLLYRLIRDKGGVPLRETGIEALENAAGQGSVRPADVDYQAAREALGPRGRAALSDAALINDFASIAAQAHELRELAPGFASALKSAAASYDESAIGLLMDGLEGKVS